MTFVLKENNRLHVLPELTNSQHAQIREKQRGISQKQVLLAYQYGVIEPELKEMNGIQLVMSSNGTVLTAFRNKDLRRVRPFKHCHKHLH